LLFDRLHRDGYGRDLQLISSQASHIMMAKTLFLTLLLAPIALTADWAAIRCDSADILPTPTYEDAVDGVFSTCTEQLIDASIADVYYALVDFQSYHLWNSFTVDVELPDNVTNTPDDVYLTMPMVFTTSGLIDGANTTSNEIVTVLNPLPTDVEADATFAMSAWRDDDGADGAFVRAEHPSILTDAGDGQTRYVSYETFYGEGALAVLALKDRLQTQFTQQGLDLKEYVEG
jgi:hypothetical protein